VIVCFINCRTTGTEYRVLSKLSATLNVAIPFTGLALGEVFDRFKKGLDSQNILFIIALDEVDEIIKKRGDKLLYELTRINENLNSSKVSLIGISNDLKFKEFLDPRVLSTLSEEEIVFPPYNADEIRNILLERSKIAFHKDVINDGAIMLCSALAASEHGDARRALDLLRVAGELAERKGDTIIFERHIREAQERIEHDRLTTTLKSLPIHSKIVLSSVFIFTKSNMSYSITGDIYNLYCEICNELNIDQLTQRRVSGLINELDIFGILNSRVVSLGRYGRTKKISLSISQSIIKKVFYGDERMKIITNYKPKYNILKQKF
jgi:cell division control protein 6